MTKTIDMVGQRYGRLTVVERISGERPRVHARCDCGREVTPLAYHLRAGLTMSCGCLKKSRYASMLGCRYARLTVLEMIYGDGETKLRARCECGGELVTLADRVRSGNTKSCGCLKHETSAEMGRARSKHGMSSTRLYAIWQGVIQRTTNPNSVSFSDYGGRGIAMCQEWREFAVFAAAVGDPPTEHHTLDRRDNSKGYEPGNVRWATKAEQNHNKRNNRYVNIEGKRMVLADAARHLGISSSTASSWLSIGRLNAWQESVEMVRGVM